MPPWPSTTTTTQYKKEKEKLSYLRTVFLEQPDYTIGINVTAMSDSPRPARLGLEGPYVSVSFSV